MQPFCLLLKWWPLLQLLELDGHLLGLFQTLLQKANSKSAKSCYSRPLLKQSIDLTAGLLPYEVGM